VILALAGLTFVASALGVWLSLPWLTRRLLDRPGQRSSHVKPTPRGAAAAGLMAWFVVSSLSWWLGWFPGDVHFRPFALCVGVLSAVGFADDVASLSRSLRYLVHLAVALTCLFWVGVPEVVGLAPALVWPLCLVFFTGLINGFNFMDGIDALVAGNGVVILGFLAWVTREPSLALLAAAYAGVLVFNWPPARAFMGDTGSTTLGGCVALGFLAGRSALGLEHLAILLPIMGDSAYTIVRRLLRRQNVLQAHHSHLYQRLLRAGHSHGRISLGYALATLFSGLSIVLGGARGALVATAACIVACVAIELHVARRRVPFVRPTQVSAR
jgi:Fuc2NAc and GlcNAc transferase